MPSVIQRKSPKAKAVTAKLTRRSGISRHVGGGKSVKIAGDFAVPVSRVDIPAARLHSGGRRRDLITDITKRIGIALSGVRVLEDLREIDIRVRLGGGKAGYPEPEVAVRHEPPAGKKPAFDPMEAGRRAVESMMKAEGGAWTPAELAKLFGLSSATLHKRRISHGIVYWRDARNQFFYPKWQFNEAGALLPGVPDVLQIFRSADEWRIMRYFLGPRSQLGERTPLDLLRAGEIGTVLAHAKLHVEKNTW